MIENKKGKNISDDDESSSSEDGDNDKSYQTSKNNKKATIDKSKKIYESVSFSYNNSMTGLGFRSLINVLARKLPQFDGTNFTRWKQMMKTYLVGLHQQLWKIVRNVVEERQI